MVVNVEGKIDDHFYLEVDGNNNVVAIFISPNESQPNDGCYLIEVDKGLYSQINERIRLLSGMKIKDKNAIEYGNLIQELTERNLSLEQEIMDMKVYLDATDFYYVRQLDSGKPVPDDVKTERDRIRSRMSELGL